jgi:hypothetical protein
LADPGCTLRSCRRVAVVLAPTLPTNPRQWCDVLAHPDKALLQISLRYKMDDHFWFSFFHEAAHILLHGKQGQRPVATRTLSVNS